MTNAEEIKSQAVSPVSTLGGVDWTEGWAGISFIGSSAHTAPAIRKLSISSRIVIFFISPLLSFLWFLQFIWFLSLTQETKETRETTET
jgi:hypothetical protein